MSKRRIIIRVAFLLVLVVLAQQVIQLYSSMAGSQDFVDDFREYWAAAKLLLHDGNPYSAEEQLAVQRTLDPSLDEPLMMYNPPWTLPFVLPFGLLSYPAARLLWLAVSYAIILVCVDWLWRYYGGSTRYRPVAWLVGTMFPPTVWVLHIGQIGPLILAGIVLFLYGMERQHWLLAGIALLPVAFKPQLLYLLWVALVVWSFRSRNRTVLLTAAFAMLTATGVALVFNLHVVGEYIAATTGDSPLKYAAPTWGTLLRLTFGDRSWLQYVPSFAGILWFLALCRSIEWRWDRLLPLLLLVSVATTSYGWEFDQVVLLPALMQVLAWLLQRRLPLGTTVGGYVAICILVVLLRDVLELNVLVLVWLPLVWLAGYVWLQARMYRQSHIFDTAEQLS